MLSRRFVLQKRSLAACPVCTVETMGRVAEISLDTHQETSSSNVIPVWDFKPAITGNRSKAAGDLDETIIAIGKRFALVNPSVLTFGLPSPQGL